jgi:hypothetical protein
MSADRWGSRLLVVAIVLCGPMAGGVASATTAAVTDTSVVSSLGPSTYGDAVSFMASVTSPDGVPDGTVTFSENDTVLAGCSELPVGTACTTSRLAAGTHTITAAYNGSPEFEPSQGTVVQAVSPATITINANDATMIYGRMPNMTYRLVGFVNGEGPDVVKGFAGCGANSDTRVGVYPEVISCFSISLVAPNYVFVAGRKGTLTIAKAVLTVAARSFSHTYGDSLLGFPADLSGFAGGETLATSGVTGSPACTSPVRQFDPAGAYPITCTQGTLAARNYFFVFSPGTLTVLRRPATLVYTGSVSVSTGSPEATTASVDLRAQLSTDSNGAALGRGTVEFQLYKNGNTAMATPDLRCRSAVDSSGAATCTLDNVPVGDWTVVTTVPADNGYYTATATVVVLNVYQPVQS